MDANPILADSLSASSGIPLYSQLVNIVKRSISAGALAPGDLLPSESALCRHFAISRSTVRQAIGALEAEGLVTRRQGRGTFVAEPKTRLRAEDLCSFTGEMRAMGLTPSSTLVEFRRVAPSPDVAGILGLGDTGETVYRLIRVRSVDGEPLILETGFYPRRLYPGLTEELIRKNSFYSLLRGAGVVPARAVDSYEAVLLGRREASLLNCRSGSCGFYVQRRTFDVDGACCEYTQSLVRGDRVRLDVQLHKDGVRFSRSVDKKEN